METEKTDTQVQINWNDINDITNQHQCITYTADFSHKEIINDNTVQRKCISAFLTKYQKKGKNTIMRHWLEIFESRNPKIILYTRPDGYHYCNIAPEDIVIMTRIVNTF